jgi:hypothetical protein
MLATLCELVRVLDGLLPDADVEYVSLAGAPLTPPDAPLDRFAAYEDPVALVVGAREKRYLNELLGREIDAACEGIDETDGPAVREALAASEGTRSVLIRREGLFSVMFVRVGGREVTVVPSRRIGPDERGLTTARLLTLKGIIEFAGIGPWAP